MDDDASEAEGPLDVQSVHDAHADFVWALLQRLGAPAADAPDLFQEVFVVLHQRRARFVDRGEIRGLLFGIALGLVRNHRRRSTRWRDRFAQLLGSAAAAEPPDDALERSRARSRGAEALARLEPDKRAVFVMFELEGLSGEQIAAILGIPLGTVHSRLHAARRSLRSELLDGGICDE